MGPPRREPEEMMLEKGLLEKGNEEGPLGERE
jgi:hypothetical protein